MSEYIVTNQVLDIVKSETDHTERPGLDAEVWVCNLPGSPLVMLRSRWQDAIDVQTCNPCEIKACAYWHSTVKSEGAWRLRYPQHNKLRDRGGYYVLIVYQPLPPGKSHRRVRIHQVIALSPSAIEARCGGSLAWKYINHDTYGWIRVTDVQWPRIISDSDVGNQDLFPVQPEASSARSLADITPR